MYVDTEKCTGCGYCVSNCPVQAIQLKNKIPVISQSCTYCQVCLRVCESGAVFYENSDLGNQIIECDACPIKCKIRLGYIGACHRYKNTDGKLVRITRLHSFEDVKKIVGKGTDESIQRPLITGIGAGTTYPDCKPAPYIIAGKSKGVDVVTVVTESPLSYSSILVKIDTDFNIGDQGAAVLAGKNQVGMVETEQYGSKILHIGGVNRLTGKNGFIVARTIVDIANKKPVKLKIENGSRLKIQVGYPPIIDNKKALKMRVGCGSATLGIFANLFVQAADEAIVLDSHITGLMSEHAAGKYAGAKPTGIELNFKQSTPGRYFGDHGNGWGGTSIVNPKHIIKNIDMNIAKSGMTILITETTGQNGIMYKLDKNGELFEIPKHEKVRKVLQAISDTCEESIVSAVYVGGAGGSARAGVVKYPVKLTKAVHSGKTNLTIGGAPAFILPGGGITFMVNVEQIKTGSFYWTPTPATICPVEYTMKQEDYEKIGGHVNYIHSSSKQLP